MGVYVVLFTMLCIATIVETYQKHDILLSGLQRKRVLHAEVCIPLLLLLFLGIFREVSVGYDAQNYYYNYWMRVKFLPWRELLSNFKIDNGFYLTLKLISLFTDNWWLARAVLYGLTFFPYYLVIRKYSPYLSLSLIIFLGNGLLGLSFGILRQALAGAVTMVAYSKMHKGMWVKALLLVMLAATIHKTALLYCFALILYPLHAKRFSATKLALISCVMFGVFSIAIPLVTSLYGGGEYYNNAGSNGGYGKLLLIVFVVTLLIYLFHITNSDNDEELVFLYNISCGALFLQIGALQWSLITRSSAFFSIYWCILIPKLINKLPWKKRFPVVLLVMVLFGVMFFFQLADADYFVLHQF